MIQIRQASGADRDDVLSFCRNTFDWGDYIDQVWDLWLTETSGQLIVAEDTSVGKVGLSHVALCPKSESIWLEGIRVHPSCRRTRIATSLIKEMLEYGRKNGRSSALTIVAESNVPSKRLMERCGFSVISEWLFHSVKSREAGKSAVASKARFASEADTDGIMNYLDRSKIYRLAARKFVASWRWYPLDLENVTNLTKAGRVIVAGDDEVAGMAVINESGYWNRSNVLQVVYLDSERVAALRDIVAFVMKIFRDKKTYEWLQVFFQWDKMMSSIVNEFGIAESERFLLYSKVFS